MSSLTTSSEPLAPLTLPALLVLAGAGFVLGARRGGFRVSRAGVGAVLAVMAVVAAPVVLTGEAGFAGYTQLDDISTFLALGAHAVEHGRDVSGLPPSTYEATLAINLHAGYPLGSFVPLAAARPLVGQDMARLWQPYLTFVMGALAACLWALAAEVVPRRGARALATFVSAQAALLYAYALQGGVKELPAAMLAALAAAVGARLLREPERTRLGVPLGVAVAALLCILNVGAAAYVGPLALALAVAAVALVRRRIVAARPVADAGLVAAAVAFLLAGPVLLVTASFADAGTSLLENETDIGNLFHPLDWKQVFGIWPAGDFRIGIGEGKPLAHALIAILAVAALAGLLAALRRRALGPPLFAATTVGALIGLSTVGSSPWVEAKGLAIASPALVLLAMLAGAMLAARGPRVLGVAVLVAVTGGVLWSNWLAYRDVKLAPRDRLAELARVGDRFAHQGPTLINEYEPYGARYFLRRMDPEAPAELRRRTVPLRSGYALGKDQWAPLDEIDLAALHDYRTIVVRRSPAESRPPASYVLRSSGRWYDVWQRRPGVRVLEDIAFGDPLDAGARARCPAVRHVAGTARRRGAELAAAVRAPAAIADLGAEPTFRPRIAVPAAGVYDAWVRGSFGRALHVAVDGRPLGSVRDERSFAGQWVRVGARALPRGVHVVALRYSDSVLRPGGGRQPPELSAVALVPRSPRPRLVMLPPARAGELCALPLDWVEAVAPA